MAAKMASVFVQMQKDAGCSEAFGKYLETNRITDAEKYAALASTEREVNDEIFLVAKAGGVVFADLLEKAAVKLLWNSCRKVCVKEDRTTEPSTAQNDDPLPYEAEIEIKKVWQKTHGFVPPDDWLLVASLQGKLWSALHATTPGVDATLLEHLRPLSCTSRQVGTAFSVIPGKSLVPIDVIADSIHRPVEIYQRCRAWFVTMAYVSIKNPAFVSYQDAIFASEKILQLVCQTFDGYPAPVSFYEAAWATTAKFFSEQLRTEAATTLSECIRNTGAWEHRWTTYVHRASNSNSQSSGSSGLPDVAADLLKQIKDIKQEAAKWQTASDRLRVENEHLRRDMGARARGGGGNDDGGKGHGGKKKNKPQQPLVLQREQVSDRRRSPPRRQDRKKQNTHRDVRAREF